MALYGGQLKLSHTRDDPDYPGLTATMVFPGMKP
jgi:hypothetical protein